MPLKEQNDYVFEKLALLAPLATPMCMSLSA